MTAATPPAGRLLLTVEEAADQLHIGRTTMYALIRTGRIPSTKIGRLRRVRPGDLATYTETL